MALYHEFTTLFGQDKSGKTKTWSARVYLNEDKTAYSVIEYGQLGGKLQKAERVYTTGKNIGRSNETSPAEQAFSETERKWKDKREKEGYRPEGRIREDVKSREDVKERPAESGRTEDSVEKEDVKEEIYLPMLAQQVKKDKLVFPVFVQPKLDGLRCLFYLRNGKWVAQSRTGAHFTTVEHIKARLPQTNLILDGELYTTSIPFETLAGLLKKKKLSEHDLEKLKQVEYHCYDVYDPEKTELPFSKRTEILNTLRLPNKVSTELMHSAEEFESKFSEYTSQGYEGIMVRTPSGLYRMNYRSKELCKYKEFEEAEYVITGFTQGEGRDEGTVIWVCQTPDGKPFNVRPRGTVEQRREWFQLGKEYVGKKLTVVYQNLSEQGVPRFPVGKSIREGY